MLRIALQVSYVVWWTEADQSWVDSGSTSCLDITWWPWASIPHWAVNTVNIITQIYCSELTGGEIGNKQH